MSATNRHGLRRWSLFLSLVMVFTVMQSASSLSPKAEAASPTLDSYVQVTSVSVSSSGTITVKYTVKKTIPSGVSIKLGWKYPTAYRNSALQNGITITGGARTGTHTMAVGKKTMVATVELSLRAYTLVESRKWYKKISSGTRVTLDYVSAAEAVGGVIVAYVPAAVATFHPNTRIAKFVGATVLGWSLGSDIKRSVTEPSGCPAVRAGQVHKITTWWTSSGRTITQKVKKEVWNSWSDYYKGWRYRQCKIYYNGISFS